MKPSSIIFISVIFFIASVQGKLTLNVNPPHCTQVTKSTDYPARYNFDYPQVYIPPGQREAYQRLFCVNPPAVNYEGTVVCDWAAPPDVQFTIGDDYMHVVRQDPTGRYLGDAVIKTQQRCNHRNMSLLNESSPIIDITEIE